MTNKMNIDMGDFFGGGEPQPAKKEPAKVTSRFGFGLMGSRRSSNSASTSSRLSAQASKQAGDDSFDNPLASAASRPKDNKAALAFASKPMPSPIITSPKTLQLASPDFKVSAKPPVPEPKLLPRTGSVRDPKPPQFLPPKSPQNAPKAPSPVLTPKGSQAKMQAERISSSSPSSQAQPKDTDKSPPPLPPRKLSPRGSVNPAIAEANAALVIEKDETKSGSQPDLSSNPAAPLSSAIAAINTPVHVAESKPPEEKQIIAAPPSTLIPEATRSVALPSDITSAALDNEVRSQVAPWTVWAEDPDKTLANDDLRSQVAPWTSEPEPPESDRRKTLAERQFSGEKPTGDENIAMDQFFSGKDDDLGTEEEFTNPLHAERHDEEEETVSKAGVSKKTWIGGGRASQASPSTARATQTQQEPEKPRIEPKKAIDYGEIFKTPAIDDDDDANAFFNDPEFKDAPDFEW